MDSPKKKQVYKSRKSLCIGAVGLMVGSHQMALQQPGDDVQRYDECRDAGFVQEVAELNEGGRMMF